jgi:hypothetical protein
VFVAQARQPATRSVILGCLNSQNQYVDRASDGFSVTGIRMHRTGHHDRVSAVGPQFYSAPGSVAAEQHLVSGGV